jgi:hypothetical protein
LKGDDVTFLERFIREQIFERLYLQI